MQNYVVLKFGGSVLHSQEDFEPISREINRFIEKGQKVVAVVSAYYGVTEQLIRKADEAFGDKQSSDYAKTVAEGEFQSATDLVGFLNNTGLQASLKDPASIAFVARGLRDSGKPISISRQLIEQALKSVSVIVVPGFSAIDEQEECILLGRGGSDISAVSIAQALGLTHVRLLKDVDGLYDRDPNIHSNAQRLAHVDYATAAELAGDLIQSEAINFAANRNVRIDIACMGAEDYSRIGPPAEKHK